MLHQVIAPHAAAYLREAGSGELHELVFIPEERRIEVDTISTWEECSLDSHRRLLAYLTSHFSWGYRLLVRRPSQWRGARRVAAACRPQVALTEVLLDEDLEGVQADVERLQTVGALMEKQSRGLVGSAHADRTRACGDGRRGLPGARIAHGSPR